MPSLRRSFGIIGLFIGLLLYAVLAVWLFAPVSRLNPLLQMPIWLVLGTAWIIPVRPLIVWIETGRWRVVPTDPPHE